MTQATSPFCLDAICGAPLPPGIDARQGKGRYEGTVGKWEEKNCQISTEIPRRRASLLPDTAHGHSLSRRDVTTRLRAFREILDTRRNDKKAQLEVGGLLKDYQ